ncbi:conserved hypothetical protein [Stigmatella aurantiaca DW4/3-1]|uniref:Uncharacterized protein n=1 Tax=Stigmatella aurantiaca (strain DW4/3-1) TaxID=378806 RepID=Q099H9_STIAD|nr:conserved hypothetical protein [Stigmatella aurantiaca DW4/3-1]
MRNFSRTALKRMQGLTTASTQGPRPSIPAPPPPEAAAPPATSSPSPLTDEVPAFWENRTHTELMAVAAACHRQRRELTEQLYERELLGVRRAIASLHLRGQGVEVGAGSRPFPLPEGVTCFYGDVRDGQQLQDYFQRQEVTFDGRLDAQTFEGVPDGSLDFVISAHVIEHLEDPINAVRNTLRVLRPGGVFLLAVPDMRFTFDHQRPPTPLEHVIADSQDGGAGTRMQAYLEHVRYVHPVLSPSIIPEDQVLAEAQRINEQRMDLHFHAWTGESFRELLEHIRQETPFQVEGPVFVVNENIFVLRRG